MLAATQIKRCGFISLSQTASVHFTLEFHSGFGDGDSECCTVSDTVNREGGEALSKQLGFHFSVSVVLI